ncbi:pilus assembly protein TadG-related protein [Microbacterium sp. A82]|uniref:pilus assembly protein TadG-related protein n=1 Tax=Microbacterium sp. A82 TaxID=3450452 RepID=UPI003F5F213B
MMAGNNDDGSILPLLLGYVVIALAAITVCVCATDLHIAQKRLDSLADSAALAGADGFTLVVDGDAVHAVLTDEGVLEQAVAIVDAVSLPSTVVSASAADDSTARVTVAAAWHPPLISPFVPDGIRLEATASSRTALR